LWSVKLPPLKIFPDVNFYVSHKINLNFWIKFLGGNYTYHQLGCINSTIFAVSGSKNIVNTIFEYLCEVWSYRFNLFSLCCQRNWFLYSHEREPGVRQGNYEQYNRSVKYRLLLSRKWKTHVTNFCECKLWNNKHLCNICFSASENGFLYCSTALRI
jgi:hypothetical protein